MVRRLVILSCLGVLLAMKNIFNEMWKENGLTLISFFIGDVTDKVMKELHIETRFFMIASWDVGMIGLDYESMRFLVKQFPFWNKGPSNA